MTDRLTPAPDRFPDAPRVGIGMIGYNLMGKAHTNGLLKIPHMMYPPVAVPVLASIAGRTESAVAARERVRRAAVRDDASRRDVREEAPGPRPARAAAPLRRPPRRTREPAYGQGCS